MRKKLPKILKTIFLLIFICQMIGLIVLLALPNLSQAEEKKPIEFKPQITIGSFIAGEGKKINPNSIGEYIQSIYKYAIGIVGILAAVVLMMGGVIWLTAGGNQTRVGEAKSWIGASLTGLIIALTSYLILATVNPALVQFRPIEMANVEATKTPIAGTCLGYKSGTCTDPAKPVCAVVDHGGEGGVIMPIYGCVASAEGGLCDNGSCPNGLHCVNTKCYDGNIGDPCKVSSTNTEEIHLCNADENICGSSPCYHGGSFLIPNHCLGNTTSCDCVNGSEYSLSNNCQSNKCAAGNTGTGTGQCK